MFAHDTSKIGSFPTEPRLQLRQTQVAQDTKAANAETSAAAQTAESKRERGSAEAPDVLKEQQGSHNCLLVGPNVRVKGAEMSDCHTAVIEGWVEGTVHSQTLRIAEAGAVVGTAAVDIAEIWGSFEGTLTVRKQLFIHSTGRITGVICYGALRVEEGGALCGDVRVVLDPPAAARSEGVPSGAIKIVPVPTQAAAPAVA